MNEQNPKHELWDIYDKDRKKTGKLHRRDEPMRPGEYHLVVHVCIFNSKNQMLIQQRQPFKSGWNNMWDLTVGGSAVAGDNSRQAAEREVYEEIGLKIDLSDVLPKFTITFSCGFDDYYLIYMDVDLSTLTLQKEEVQRVKWADKEEILQMQENGTFIPYWFLDKLFDLADWNDKYRNEETAIHVEYARECHLESWMNLAEIIREHLGIITAEQMASYREMVKKNISRGTAVCALFGNVVAGILIYSYEEKKIQCIEVHPAFDRKNIEQKLLSGMIPTNSVSAGKK